MTAKSSNLSLNEFFIRKINIEWVQGDHSQDENSENNINVAFDYQVGQKVDQENLFRLTLIVKIEPDKYYGGLIGEVHVDGFFSFPEGTDEREMQYLVRLNGCSILYSLLRGQLALISGSFPCGKFTLPAVVMNDVIKGIEEQRSELDS